MFLFLSGLVYLLSRAIDLPLGVYADWGINIGW